MNPFLTGDENISYRDPTAIFTDGKIRLFFSYVRREERNRFYWYTAFSDSTDMKNWSDPKIITPKSLDCNYSSPGNIINVNGNWKMCLQTLPTPEPLREDPERTRWSPKDPYHVTGDHRCRIFSIDSPDLESWSEPQLLQLKGSQTPSHQMGRMIDPFFVEDLQTKGKWWCLYKQNGMSLSHTIDFKKWHYSHSIAAGENVCAIHHEDKYFLYHSPENGIALKTSKDLVNWTDIGLLEIRGSNLPWTSKRLTAGFVIDLRQHSKVEAYVMFFHGSSPEWIKESNKHGHCSIGYATSHDLVNWKIK